MTIELDDAVRIAGEPEPAGRVFALGAPLEADLVYRKLARFVSPDPYGFATLVNAGDVLTLREVAPITSGVFRISFRFLVDDSEVAGDNTKDALIYLLPTGVLPTSANSITLFSLGRNTASVPAATPQAIAFTYRNASAFQAVPQADPFPRGAWVKVAIVANFAAHTFDLYLNDILWSKALTWANGAAADFSRIVALAQPAAPVTYIDDVEIEKDWVQPTESVLIEHDFTAAPTGEIEVLSPPTDGRNVYPQPWKIPDDLTTYGAFTVGANGAQADAAKVCVANARCRPDGILECEFRTSVAGVIYFGLQFRFWDLNSLASAGLFRIFGGGSNTAILSLPDAAGGVQTVQTSALTPIANTIYTLKIELRGRYITCSYKAAAMDSGSYTQLWAHQITSSVTGGRGMLSEEEAGPLMATTLGAVDNYVRRFRFTGRAPGEEQRFTIGQSTYVLCAGSLREWYHAGVRVPTRNLFWSKGLQWGHRSSADMGNYAIKQTSIYDGADIKSFRQVGLNLTEYQQFGVSDCYITFLRRGPWIADRTTMWGVTQNFAPDHDFRGELWVGTYRHAGPTGAGASATDLAYHDWRDDRPTSELPLAFQRLTGMVGNNVRMTFVGRNNYNLAGPVNSLTHKFTGSASPISQAIGRNGNDMTDRAAYECGRAYLIECGALALSDAVLTGFRDDVAVPAVLTVQTGGRRMDLPGDLDRDGFNERHGWYEIDSAGGAAQWIIPVASGVRYMPVFRLHGANSQAGAVLIDGVQAIEGIDYVLDTFAASGEAILQILRNLNADTTFSVA